MGTLFVIATPIGNRADLSRRAERTLRSVDLIVSETPRVSKKLLDPLGITTKTVSIILPGRRLNSAPVLTMLKASKDVALISEAGTPGINDPGGLLVSIVREAGHEVKAIPGPNAAIAAASISGFPMEEFIFKGFVPHKKGRETFFKQLDELKEAIIFYESPHRLRKTIDSLRSTMPERYLCVVRELTKLYEQSKMGRVNEIAQLSEEELPAKGEFVLVLAPKGFVPQSK